MEQALQLERGEVGFDVPAAIGMAEAEVQTPCLIIDLDALDRNLVAMREKCAQMGVRLRVHGKMHKCAELAKRQIEIGGACGICAQKTAEAEAFARAGVMDILLTNQVRDPLKIDRLSRLPLLGARIIVCVDALENVAELSGAAMRHGTMLDVLVEIDCGAGRCGVAPGASAVEIAKAVAATPGLRFSGLQAYHGGAQHLRDFGERKSAIEAAIAKAGATVEALAAAGLACETVGGGGTGSFAFEGASGVYNELQCGSYAFMDADYQQVRDQTGAPISEFENAFFLLTSVMSKTKPGFAVCDAGLKAQSLDSGLPVIFGRDDVSYTDTSDEHGKLSDPHNVLAINERLRLVPGHCDPTCNLHDWFVCLRDGKVVDIWPITARGKGY